MSEKVRFFEMTKPTKFRRLKLIKNYIVLWWGGVRERIKYISYNILYKLHILKRYSYRTDWTEKFLPAPVFNKHIRTKHYDVNLVSHIREVYMDDTEYFYKQMKDGSKKILYVVKDEEEHKFFLAGHLENISMSVDGKDFYYIDQLPIFRVAIFEPDLKPYNEDWKPSEPTFRTVTYDTRKLKGLRHQLILSDSGLHDHTIDEKLALSNEELDYCFNEQVKEFEHYLNNLSLKDLEV